MAVTGKRRNAYQRDLMRRRRARHRSLLELLALENPGLSRQELSLLAKRREKEWRKECDENFYRNAEFSWSDRNILTSQYWEGVHLDIMNRIAAYRQASSEKETDYRLNVISEMPDSDHFQANSQAQTDKVKSPLEDKFACACGKYEGVKYTGLRCEKCSSILKFWTPEDRRLFLARPGHVLRQAGIGPLIGHLEDLRVADDEAAVLLAVPIQTAERWRKGLIEDNDAVYQARVKWLVQRFALLSLEGRFDTFNSPGRSRSLWLADLFNLIWLPDEVNVKIA